MTTCRCRLATSARDVYAAASRLPDDDQRNRDRFRHDDLRGARLRSLGPAAARGSGDARDGRARPGCRARRTRTTGCRTSRSATIRRCSRAIRVASPFRRRCTPSAPTSPRATRCWRRSPRDCRAAERLALTHAGAAAHHLEDVANQIHTVQVGIYEFFVDAKIESIKEELRSVGGLLRTASELRLDRHRHHLQSSHPRRVAFRQAPARAERSRRSTGRRGRAGCRAPARARRCSRGVHARVRTRDRRGAHRALELRRARGLSRHPRRRATPLVSRRTALRRRRRSRCGAQAGRRSVALLRTAGRRHPTRHPDACGLVGALPRLCDARRRRDQHPRRGAGARTTRRARSRATPARAATPRGRRSRTSAAGGCRSAMLCCSWSSPSSCWRRRRRRGARSESSPDRAPPRRQP